MPKPADPIAPAVRHMVGNDPTQNPAPASSTVLTKLGERRPDKFS